MALQACPDCGFDPASTTPSTAAAEVARWTGEYSRRVSDVPPELMRRRDAGLGWSSNEYVGHVRDVMALFTARVRLVLGADRPDLPVLDHEAVVAAGGYREQDSAALLQDLVVKAGEFGHALAGVDRAGWQRVGLRAGDERSVLEIAQRAVHEARHHLWDIERLLTAGGRRRTDTIAPAVEE